MNFLSGGNFLVQFELAGIGHVARPVDNSCREFLTDHPFQYFTPYLRSDLSTPTLLPSVRHSKGHENTLGWNPLIPKLLNPQTL